MDQLLIATKLSIPSVPPNSIHRPHLEQRLQHAFGSGQRLVLISAPAGFGKSTLVTSWIKQGMHPPIAWLSLDADDNYPEMFLQYLLAALAEAVSPETLPAFRTSWNELTDATLRLSLTPIVNELARHALPLMIVFDDYHEISNQLVHNILTFLLKYLPPCVQIVITSRTDPPLPLAMLRARQQLCEVRMADLRFDQQEMRAFFHKRWPLPLPEDVLQTIATNTEGWPAGLHFAALVASSSSSSRPELLRAIFEDGDGFMLEYLAEEVFHHLPAPMQQFLVRTSILDRLTHDLCQAVMGDVADAPTLGQVLRRNLFLIQLGEQPWYRYHHLFLQFLRTRLNQALSQQDIAILHVRASTWFMQHGFQYEALNHVVQAKAWEKMLQLLTPAPRLHQIFSTIHIWRRWLDALPDDVIRSRFDLYLIKVWGAVLGSDLTAAEDAIDHSGMTFPEASQGSVHLLRTHIAMFRGQRERQMEEAKRALELLSQQEQPLLWALAAVIFGGKNLHHGVLHTPPVLDRAWELSTSLGEPMLMLLAASTLCEFSLLGGKLRRAASWVGKVRGLVTSGYTIGAPYWCRMAARVAYEQNDLVQAEQIVKQGLELVQITGRRHNIPTLHLVLAHIYQALGAADEANIDSLLTQAQAMSQQYGLSLDSAEIEAYQVRRWLAQGELQRAKSWNALHALDPSTLAISEYHWLIVAYVYLARACMRAESDIGLATTVEQALTHALAITAADGRLNDHIRLLTNQALLLWDLRRSDEAVASLSKALELGASEGYVRMFLDEGSDLLPLLAHPTVVQAAPTLVAQLRALLEPQVPNVPIAAAAPELLSRREQEILRLLAAGRSVHELATHLVISVHTARTHLKHIYTKLDAHTRIQAIKHAQECGLL